ncbi:hypothetical protein [Humisphaera borealis]|uniref:Uncharacterized protein n=1 Tax=Humisphaera borealis TaxID=2807512 RepID=A0A7M2X3S4_9BACT|nr:hypothetical protein [Humisphaera borealis]QOV91420.1 hypothetical protein IPV69_08720 [Humisphaera borealis]
MLAFGLVLLLFFYFLLVGSAALRQLHARREATQDLLMSPTVGAIFTVVPLFVLNRMFSIPVAHGGPVVAILALAISIFIYWRGRRPTTSAVSATDVPDSPEGVARLAASGAAIPAATAGNWKRDLIGYLPFLLILLAGALSVGRPMLDNGFDWLSFSNDDMANYALAGDRLLRHGFEELPPLESLTEGTEYAQSYWYYHVPMMARSGAEMMLAWVCSLTGLSSHQAFMPLIVCFHIMMAGAATAMIYTSPDRRRAALCACVLSVASAQLAFGTIYQLIAQDIGLAVLCVNASILIRDFTGLARGTLLRHGILLGVTATGQMLIYPEVNPFLGVSFFLYLAYLALRSRKNLKPLLLMLAIGVVVALIVLNSYTYNVLAFMVGQKEQGARSDDPALTLFPFFLIPSGFANFWGLVQITSMPPEPGFSITIAVGALLLLLSAVAAIWLTWRSGEPAAALALVSIVLAVYLFRYNSGFGLYKLAMFAQAFILPTIALAWTLLLGKFDVKPKVRLTVYQLLVAAVLVLGLLLPNLPEGKTIAWVAGIGIAALAGLYAIRRVPSLVWLILILAIPNLRLQGFYVLYSRDEGGGTFNEVLGATRGKVLREFVRELDQAQAAGYVNKDTRILCDSYNISLTKLLSAYTAGRVTSFPASRLTAHTMIPNAPPEAARTKYKTQARSLFEPTIARSQEAHFEFDPAHPGGDYSAKFFLYEQGGRSADPTRPPDDPNTLLVAGTRQISMLNRRHFGDGDGSFVMRPITQVQNHLLFVDSNMSEPYYKPGDPSFISLYQLERDPAFYVTSTMAGVGRYFLFEVINPEQEVRLFLDLTMSFKGDYQNKLPKAFAVGTERQPFATVGRGACRLVSPPIKPQRVRGRSYVGIDLGEFGTKFSVERTGFMKLYGMNVGLDRRLLVGFGRDISLLGEAEYRAFNPPSTIYIWGSPESQLRHPDVEFSGLCEDGWMSEHSYVILGQKLGETRLVVRGFVADLGNPAFTTTPTLLVDGVPVPLMGTVGEKPYSGSVGVANFNLYADVPATSANRRKVELKWSAYQQLLGLDSRKASAKIQVLGFQTPAAAATEAPATGK